MTLPFDAGSGRERELFADCVVSTESKALRHLFFAEREAAKVPDIPKTRRPATIRHAAVVGAGTMGGGIAMTYANAGIPVLLKDVDEAALERGLATIRRNYDVDDVEGQDDARTQVEQDDGAHHADDDVRRLRSAWTSSSRPCSRTWT